MTARRVFLALAAGAAALACSLPARATQYLPECAELAYVAKTADVIVHGAVEKVEAREDKGGMINTYVRVRVSRWLKGKGGKTLTIKRLGGRIEKDGQGLEVSDGDGPWQVKPGDRGYLYLKKPVPVFYEGRHHGLFCGWGLTDQAPPSGKR